MSCVYRYKNTVNGKSYIGYAIDLERRSRRHKRDSAKGVDNKFYRAVRKYGWDVFDLSVLYHGSDNQFTHEIMEPYMVRQYNSYHDGYNGDEGGLGCIGAVRNRIWVNNGVESLRVDPDHIPEGYSRGRLTFSRSIRSKWSPDRKPRRSYVGANNPAAKVVVSPDGEYPTRVSAAKAHGVSESTIGYWIQTKDNWKYKG